MTLAIVVAMLPLVVLGAWLWSSTGELYREQLDENLALASQLEADYIADSVTRAAAQLVAIADDPQTAAAVTANNAPSANSEATSQAIVDQSFEQHGPSDGLLGVAVVDGASEVIAAAGRPTDPSSRGLVRLVPPGVDRYFGDAMVQNDTTSLAIVAPMSTTTAGNPLFLVSEWDLDLLTGRESTLEAVGASVSASLLQQQTIGRYQVLVPRGGEPRGSVVTVGSVPEDNRPRVTATTTRGEPMIEAVALVEGTSWLYQVSAEESEIYAALRSLETRVAQALLIGGVVLLAVLVTVLRSFSARLIRIAGLAQSVADGDLSVRIDDRSRDEIGLLSRAFDRMTSALQIDIDRREAVEAQLAYQASHDALTGLPNRPEMLAFLDRTLSGPEEIVSLLFVDLDGFKEVNDTLGHEAGDELLVAVADRLRHSLRRTDFVARLGGDEFVVVLPGTGTDAAERMATQIVQTLELPFMVQDETASISASIGVASSDDDPSTEDLVKQADIAMYRAKSLGKGRAIRVTADALAEIEARAETQVALREGLGNDELILAFSPVALLDNGEMRGLAVSTSWVHPTQGEVEAKEFARLADSIGFATRVDAWTVRRAIEQFGQWQTDGLLVRDLTLEINLSDSTFMSPRYRTLVSDACEAAGVERSAVRVGVPESVLREDSASIRAAFDHYRQAGIAITISSFGADFADLQLLAQFGLQGVQIDVGRFDGRIHRNTIEASIRSLVELAKRAGLEVSAIGVDNEQLRVDAAAVGATEGQGLWFASPLSADRVAHVLANRYLVEF